MNPLLVALGVLLLALVATWALRFLALKDFFSQQRPKGQKGKP